MIDRSFARDEIQRRRPVQGNLDPLVVRPQTVAVK
jgi:hypothetical protein